MTSSSISINTVAGKLQETSMLQAMKAQREKNLKNPVIKASNIGCDIGLIGTGAFFAKWAQNIYKGEFDKFTSEAVTNTLKNTKVDISNLKTETVLKNAAKATKDAAKKAAVSTKKILKNLDFGKIATSSMLKAGLALGAIGAGIGLIVKVVGNHKAQKAEQAAQLNKNA